MELASGCALAYKLASEGNQSIHSVMMGRLQSLVKVHKLWYALVLLAHLLVELWLDQLHHARAQLCLLREQRTGRRYHYR